MCSGPLSRRSFFRNGCSTLWAFTFSLPVDILPSSAFFSYRTACFLLPAFSLFRRILKHIRLSGVFMLICSFKIPASLWPTGVFVHFTLSCSREISYPCSLLLLFHWAAAHISLRYFSITACLLPCLQFKVAFDALLARAPAVEQISRIIRTSHRRPPSCSRFATWLPS